MNLISNLVVKLINPVSKNDDYARREFILNLLLFGTGLLAFIVSISASIAYTFLLPHGDQSLPLAALYSSFIFCFILLWLSKIGKARAVSYIFIGLYLAFTIYTAYHWGVYVPQALLFFALIITMSGILISSRFAFYITCFIIFINSIIFYLQNKNLIHYDPSWQQEPILFTDVIVYLSTLMVIALVSWLYNKELETALKRAIRSENALKKEKDSLEIKVKERTQELEQAQIEKINQISRFIEFGKISSGLFHDLMNYISILFLSLEKAASIDEKEIEKIKYHVNEANNTRACIQKFINSTKEQLQNKKDKKHFSLTEDIKNIIDLFSYKIKCEKIEIDFKAAEDINIFGNQGDLNHVIANLISNAIDAYSKIEREDKKINITVHKKEDFAVIEVQDFGCGIDKKDIDKIFNPFFTTKENKGSGIGLSASKNIIENNFNGAIEVESKLNEGSLFRIEIKIYNGE